jgi:hypothetical protein
VFSPHALMRGLLARLPYVDFARHAIVVCEDMAYA